MRMKYVNGSRYLGIFVGYKAADDSWLADKVQGWTELVKNMSGIAPKHPQSAYSGLQKSLQQEWEFMQLITPGIVDAFGLVEKALQETFIQALLQGLVEGTTGRGVTSLPLKHAVLDLPDTTKTAHENWMDSCVITGHLVTALRGQEEFRTSDHSTCLLDGRMAVRKCSTLLAEEALEKTLAGAPVQGACRLQQATKTRERLTVQPSTVNGTELGAQEW